MTEAITEAVPGTSEESRVVQRGMQTYVAELWAGREYFDPARGYNGEQLRERVDAFRYKADAFLDRTCESDFENTSAHYSALGFYAAVEEKFTPGRPETYLAQACSAK
ncbi:MAG: hypothetical protein A2284_01790 [Deltaproteobacteria bacterium RIFOXYA12_FULL_61_11]|nr:MAG: hypothetical protein A2284_01790 [Deltaproteobacteria bacterium RIFOXYA12_FULL_61_11]